MLANAVQVACHETKAHMLWPDVGNRGVHYAHANAQEHDAAPNSPWPGVSERNARRQTRRDETAQPACTVTASALQQECAQKNSNHEQRYRHQMKHCTEPMSLSHKQARLRRVATHERCKH